MLQSGVEMGKGGVEGGELSSVSEWDLAVRGSFFHCFPGKKGGGRGMRSNGGGGMEE